ncbi:MAG: hypothetical protein IMX00_05055 [Limnochordales bacterium]|nr:hypothetical protein [Limnochordales bacterium]
MAFSIYVDGFQKLAYLPVQSVASPLQQGVTRVGAATRPEVDWEALEQSLAELRGVHSCKVVTSDTGELAEVHVVAEGRSVQELIGEIEALFQVQAGFVPDRQKISIALLGSEKGIAEERRIELHSYSVEKTREGLRIRVELAWHHSVYAGDAEGGRSGETGPVVAAEATVRAIQAGLPDGEHLRVEEATVTRLGDTEIVLVALALQKEGGEIPLLGTSVVRGDKVEATIKACLDGLNRYLGCQTGRVGR